MSDPTPADWRDRVLLRVREAAPLLSYSPSRLYRICKAGEFPSVKVGGAVRIRVRDLQVLLGEIEADQ